MSSFDTPADALDALDAAWSGEGVDSLEDLLHPDVVVLGPDMVARAEGREACIAGYRDFLERAEVDTLDVTDRRVHQVGNTAVASSRFRLGYRIDGEVVEETGSDVWVLVKLNGGWQAAWRLLTSSEVR